MAFDSVPIDENSIFQQLDSYHWDQDPEFQVGLSAILGPATDNSQIQELTLRAKVFYLSRKKNIPIDFDGYKAYLSSKSSQTDVASSVTNSTTDPDHISSEPETPIPPPHTHHVQSLSSEPPSSQPADNTNPLEASTDNFKPPQAPYPSTFAEIVALITSGAPIPGIKDIPSTILTEQATKPVAPKRRKPWEVDVPDEVVQGEAGGTFGDRRDEIVVQEFPE